MNPINHFEIPADDMGRATTFYKDVFGWEIDQYPGDDMQYWIARTTPVDEQMMPLEKGAINGGMYPRVEKEGPMVVVTVEDIEAHVKKVTDAGGSVVVEPVAVGDMGMYARVTDSEGNLLGLWQTVQTEGAA